MNNVFLGGGLDLAELVFYLFFLFFLGLVIYLRREDRREGYPLEDDLTGALQPMGALFEMPTPKTFRFNNQPDVVHPTFVRDTAELAADRPDGFAGSPLVPRGDALNAGVGPASWVSRLDIPDVGFDGHHKIVPMRIAGHGFHIDPRDPNPIGMVVIGADGLAAGTVTDVWVDVPERSIRFLEVAVNGAEARPGAATPVDTAANVPESGAGTLAEPAPAPAVAPTTSPVGVLVPMPMANVRRSSNTVYVGALTAAQFAGAPGPLNPGSITRREEERIYGYFGGGYLYATADRAEPFA